VRELAGDGVPVTVTCRVLKLARQPYYRWLKHPISDAELVEAYRANALFDAHRDDPEFGHRLLADEARNVGQSMGLRRVGTKGTREDVCFGSGPGILATDRDGATPSRAHGMVTEEQMG
jgi:hypothetical protein